MFLFDKRKDNTENKYMDRLVHAVRELKQGKQNYLPIIYQALATNDKKVVQYAACEIAQFMCSLNSNQIIRLEERFREYSSMEWYIFWEKVDLVFWKENIKNQEDFLWTVRLGTFHPNGYFREKCIWELAGDDNSVRFILLRLNDWVLPVREAAEAACTWISELNAEELVACLPYLEKIKQGRRRDRNVLLQLDERIVFGIQEQLPSVDLKNLKKYDLRTRKFLYRLLLEHKFLSKEEVNQVLSREKNSQCQFLLMTMLLRHYDTSIEELDKYLEHKSKVVQRKALEQKYSMLGTYWNDLEKMLLASSIGVRSQVSYILQKHTKIDIVAYYKERLETAQIKVCILGIGENGKADDVNVLMKYLEDPREGIVKTTIHAISLLIGPKAENIYWKYLQDERPIVLRSAYREIVANDVIFGAKQVYELFVQTKSNILREKLVYQLLRERSWDRLPYILKLYWYEDETLRAVLRRGVNGRSVYGQVSMEYAAQLRNIMYNDKYHIPAFLQKSIEFDLKFVTKGEKH